MDQQGNLAPLSSDDSSKSETCSCGQDHATPLKSEASQRLEAEIVPFARSAESGQPLVASAEHVHDPDDDLANHFMHPSEKVDAEHVGPLEGFSNRELMYQFLKNLGENPEREGLKRTPYRIEKAWDFITSGYELDVSDFINKAVFDADCDEMVIVKDIRFYSMCEHHLLPFYGTAHVAYIPNGKVVGLSKIPRIVNMYSRRLQIQERLGTQIAECINEVMQPKGVAVVMNAVHFCMMMRGVQQDTATTTTSAMLGEFREKPDTRAEFLKLIEAR